MINLLKKRKSVKLLTDKGGNIRTPKKDIPMNKEWYNSLYGYNKNYVRILPFIYNETFRLLKLYFNMTNDLIEEKIQSRNYKKIRKYSGKKFWISSPEIKYFNETVNITIYNYNKNYNFYKNKLQLTNFIWEDGKINYDNNRYFVKIIKWLKLNKYLSLIQYKSKVTNLLKKNFFNTKLISLDNLKNKHYDYLLNIFNKELIYLKFKQIILFHEFKYNELYLFYIINFLEKLYKKRVVCNIITLKYYHLSTSILLQIISTKIKHPKARGKYLLPVDSAINNVKVPILSRNKLSGEDNRYIGVQNVKFIEYSSKEKNHLNKFLLDNAKSERWSNKDIDNLVLTNLEYKTVGGIYIKVAGRLTKRFKAQRAISILRSKGTLQNAYSAHKNMSSSLSRGYSNINVEKGRIDSNLRIGAFGLTGWIASY